MSRAPSYTVLMARAGEFDVEHALDVAMELIGLCPALGLAITREQMGLDPHERTRRYFRLRPQGEWVLVLELGSDSSADYFLASALAAAGLKDVAYAALSHGLKNGTLGRFSATRKPRELWLEHGQANPELSTLTPGTDGAMGLLREWGAPAESPGFEDGDEPILAYYTMPQ